MLIIQDKEEKKQSDTGFWPWPDPQPDRPGDRPGALMPQRGEKGDPGAAASVTVGTVTTLEPGEDATVTNVGTDYDAILNFGIPKGANGAAGTVIAATPQQYGAVGDGVTDDTEAFYEALKNNTCLYLPKGTYLIDFKNVVLTGVRIVGLTTKKSMIKQKNKNVPFCILGKNSGIENVYFTAVNNDTLTDIITLGYGKGISRAGVEEGSESYHSFENALIRNVEINANKYANGVHYNTRKGGSPYSTIEKCVFNQCHKAIWYEFVRDTSYDGQQWITGHTCRDILVKHPIPVNNEPGYGIDWSMISEIVANGHNEARAYDNLFEDCIVTLNETNTVGFRIGNEMGVISNPMVFNDIISSTGIGYCLELCPIKVPFRIKHDTEIYGGNLEGIIKNEDFIGCYDIHNLKIQRRNNASVTYVSDVIDSDNITHMMHLGLDTILASDNTELTNCTAELHDGADGTYIMLTPSGSGVFGLEMTIPADDINALGYVGKHTYLVVSENSLGDVNASVHGLLNLPESTEYTIDSGLEAVDRPFKSRAYRENANSLSKTYVFEAGTQITDDAVIRIKSSEIAGTRPDWIKVYGVAWLTGLVGNGYIERRVNTRAVLDNLNSGSTGYDDTEVRGLISAKYTKPSSGIPKTDLATAVQTSLGKADSALQSLPTHSHAQSDITGLSTALNAKLTTPSGGTDGQVLTKTASGYAWQTPSGGGDCNIPILQSVTLVDLYNELSDTTNCIGICLGINDYYYSYDGGVDPTQHDAEENPQIVSIYERQTDEVDYIGVVLTASGHIYYWDFRESTPMVMRKFVADEALEGLATLATQIDEDIGL